MWQCEDGQLLADDEGKPVCFLCVILEFIESGVDVHYVIGIEGFEVQFHNG
jgi:hypothetical protein